MKTCFVICPIGDSKSIIRKRSDKVLELIIKPVAVAAKYEVNRADLMHEHQWTIPESISDHILKDDLLIADLTDCNPNVFYELGKRHAWGGRSIHLATSTAQLPFDVSHYRVITYDIDDDESIERARRELRLAIKHLGSIPPQAPAPLTPEKIIDLTGATILLEAVGGRRDHYYLAEKIAKKNCKKIFMMQRSSTLVLGPEQGWGAEEIFYRALIEKLNDGTEFFHIVSIDGITRHLQRPQSVFPNIDLALSRLSRTDDCVGIVGKGNNYYFRRVPDAEDDEDLKPDRQARAFLVEYEDGECEGVVVVDLGGKQVCFHFKGPKIREFFAYCVDFYHTCPLLKWRELEKALQTTQDISA